MNSERYYKNRQMKQERPYYSLLVITVSIFVAESVAMFLLSNFSPMDLLLEGLLDSSLLIILVSPMLYFFLLRPMFLHIAERNQFNVEFRKLNRAIDQSPAVVLITDTEGTIKYVNPKFTSVTGYTKEEAIGKNPRILKSGEMSKDEYKVLWDTILSGNEWHGELSNKKKNGEIYWESASISPIRNREGDIVNFVGVKEDITERKKMEAKLVKSGNKFRALFEGSGDAVMTLDEKCFLDCNDETIAIFGCSSKEEFIGKHASEFPPTLQARGISSAELAQERITTALRDGKNRFE